MPWYPRDSESFLYKRPWMQQNHGTSDPRCSLSGEGKNRGECDGKELLYRNENKKIKIRKSRRGADWSDLARKSIWGKKCIRLDDHPRGWIIPGKMLRPPFATHSPLFITIPEKTRWRYLKEKTSDKEMDQGFKLKVAKANPQPSNIGGPSRADFTCRGLGFTNFYPLNFTNTQFQSQLLFLYKPSTTEKDPFIINYDLKLVFFLLKPR